MAIINWVNQRMLLKYLVYKKNVYNEQSNMITAISGNIAVDEAPFVYLIVKSIPKCSIKYGIISLLQLKISLLPLLPVPSLQSNPTEKFPKKLWRKGIGNTYKNNMVTKCHICNLMAINLALTISNFHIIHA